MIRWLIKRGALYLKEHFNSPRKRSDGVVLGLHEGRQVQGHVAAGNAPFGQIARLGHVIIVRVVEQGL